MLFFVFCEDKPDTAGLRQATRDAHIAYLKDAGARVRLGGPTLGKDGNYDGGIMVVEADSLDAARSFVAADPFVRAGVCEPILIRPWRWLTGNPDLAQ